MSKSESIRILYMEDDPGLALLVQKKLERAGYTVDHALNGEKGLAMYRKGCYDVVAVDQNMPVYDGLEVIRNITSQEPLLPTIMITGKGDEKIAVEAMKLGACDYVVKDVEGGYLELLPSVIKQAIQKQRLVKEKQQALDALRESEEKYRVLVENANDFIYMIDINNKVLSLNKFSAKLFGKGPKEIIGKSILNIFPKKIANEFAKNLRKVFKTKKVLISETKIIVGEKEMWISNSLSPVKNYEGKVIAVMGVSRDITEQKQIEDEKEKIQSLLFQSQKMESIGRLAGGVAHEFNNLLTGILGYSDLLLIRIGEKSSLRKDIEAIKKAAKMAASLAHHLLIFSRKQKVKLEVLDLNAVVVNFKNLIQRLIDKNINLVLLLDPTLENIKSDTSLIEQIIGNLVINARDAIPSGGKLTIKTENIIFSPDDCKDNPDTKPGKYVCLTVSDTGVGMDKEIIHRMFEPFFSTKEVGMGTGLGLSVVYGIVKQHNGWINVKSEPNQGSTFDIYFPVFSTKLRNKKKEEVSLQNLYGNGQTILVVEDEEIVRKLATRILREKGYVVFEAENVKEALDIFKRENGKFNLVFSDVVLPGKNGLQLVDQLLTHKPNLKVLFSSGYADDKSKRTILLERGFQFLQKPYTPSDLLLIVREILRQK